MADKTQPTLWLDKHQVLHPDHVNDLETRAAIHEFNGKLPRHEAEQKAHDEYVKEHRLKAAAHHLLGMKAAQATGDMDAARKHGVMYNLHVKALGHDPMAAPPPELMNLNREGPGKLYRFKPHVGDFYALDTEKGV